MRFFDFKKRVALSQETICREILSRNRERVRIKKDEVAVKNLVKIFDAVLNISNRKGFYAMSLRDLSRETNLSMGALYSYFSSKEELLDMIQEQGRNIVGRFLMEAADHYDSVEERLRAVIYTHLYLSEILHPWFYFSYMEAKNLGRPQQKKAIESELYTETIIRTILEDGNKNGAFSVPDAYLAAGGIKALLQDWYLKRWKHIGRKISVENYAIFVINFINAFIQADMKK